VSSRALPHDLAVAIEAQPDGNLLGHSACRRDPARAQRGANIARVGNRILRRRAMRCGIDGDARARDADTCSDLAVLSQYGHAPAQATSTGRAPCAPRWRVSVRYSVAKAGVNDSTMPGILDPDFHQWKPMASCACQNMAKPGRNSHMEMADRRFIVFPPLS
jgi:hypothetical protein